MTSRHKHPPPEPMPIAAKPLRVLLVEDSENDAELVLLELRRSGDRIESERVQTAEALNAALERQAWDIVISDYQMPGFNAPTALKLVRRHTADLPFIVVSGTVGEDVAVEVMKTGANDYVMKDKLARLGPVVKRELHDAEMRRGRRRAEQALGESETKYRELIDQASDGIFVTDKKGNFLLVNSRYREMLGYSEDELLRLNAADTYIEEEKTLFAQRLANIQGMGVRIFERVMRRKDGTHFPVEVSIRWLPNGTVQGIVRDISERKRSEQLLQLEHAVAVCLADADNSTDGLKAVIRAVCETEGWECGRYFRLDEKAGVLRFDESWHVPDPAIENFCAASHGLTFAPGVGLAGLVWQSGEALCVPDVTKDTRPSQAGIARQAGIHSGFVFPVRAEGTTIGVLAFSSRQVRQPDERLLQAIHIIGSQIGQFMVRMEQQERIVRLNRIHRVLSGINTLIVRVRDRDELFRESCRIAVEAGGFQMAWLGIIDREAMQINPVAWAGAGQDYIELVPLDLSEPNPEGRGLARQAVKQRKAIIVDDMTQDPRVSMKKEAMEHGFHSLAMLPLLVSGESVGMLALYASEIGFFNEEEMKLLLELAGDISFALDHIEKEEKLEYLAYYDTLTGLANRTLFHERLVQYVESASHDGHKLALLIVDIDRFKTINDTFGRTAGDELLRQIAGRIEHHAGPIRMARLSADSFAIVRSDISSESEVARVIDQWLAECFGPPYVVSGTELRVSAKAGIALFPNDGTDADALFRNAEAALKKAKATGERYLFHTQQMTERTAEKLALENKLRQALEKNEFVLHYQPKVDIETRRILGVEALIRWNSPELGLVPPMQFIPLMEETGMILEVGAWALQRAVLDHRHWLRQKLAAPRIAVNVSAIQLSQRDFVEVVQEALRQGANPAGIDLEITESLIMQDMQGNIAKLKHVQALGVNIAIDDFGTGYSSLAYLAKLPVNTLKIDRSFIIAMANDPDTMTLVSTIITLAHSMRLKVVAEGVETEEQARMLRLLRCDEMQGYLISKPVPHEELMAMLGKSVQ